MHEFQAGAIVQANQSVKLLSVILNPALLCRFDLIGRSMESYRLRKSKQSAGFGHTSRSLSRSARQTQNICRKYLAWTATDAVSREGKTNKFSKDEKAVAGCAFRPSGPVEKTPLGAAL
jgi:hypothetical protein